MSYVEVKQLSKKYKDSVVIDNQSFTIEKGEFVTLLGPSGCGKSTLLRCIAGLTDIEQGGCVIVGDVDLTWLQPKDRQVGMVFQSYALFPNMTLYENIAFGLKIKGMSKEVYDEKVKRMIEVVDLKGKENHYPHQLSGGQQQRVALARSLVVEPRILLLDEPLSALDAQIRKNLQIEIKKIQRELGITTIFVTHDQEEALMLSDRIFVMQEGIIVQSGTPEEIYSSPQTEFVARFIGHYNVLTDQEWSQLTNLTSRKGTHYAIRPEVLKICSLPQFPGEKDEEAEEGKWVSGRIISKDLKGNIIRYRVETSNHIIMTVDELNTSDAVPCNESNILIWIPIQKCIALEEGV